jgi:phosphoheptose isomerase
MQYSTMKELSQRVKVSLQAQEDYLNLHSAVLTRAGASLGAALARGNKLIALGCPTVAQHMAAELTGRFLLERPGLPAICLSENNSAVTAILNNDGASRIYVRQLMALAQKGDFVLGFLAGGGEAAQDGIDQAQQMGLETLALELVDSEEWTATETFLIAAHLLCEGAEAELQRLLPERFPSSAPSKKRNPLPDLMGVPL